jgi:muramoyltetrapeptide carboxypeptidase
MIRPPHLKPGDRVALVAPARKITEKELEACFAILDHWQLKPVLAPHLYAQNNQFAGADAQRLQDLQWALDAPDIQAVLCARGGYGTLRLLDQLDLKGIKKHPKWVIGFSDLTALLVRLFQEGIESIHGPMGISFAGATANAQAVDHLGRILMQKGQMEYGYTPLREDLIRPGHAHGKLLGGNLSILSQLLGTETDFDTRNTLFFLEDLSEYLYHIDRMMVHLKRGRKLERLGGCIVGGMTEMKDNEQSYGKDAESIVAEHAHGDYPFCTGFPVGHWPENYPLVVGREAYLSITHTSVTLQFEY